MGGIVFPKGEGLSSPFGEFYFSPLGFQIRRMVTIYETRRNRLRLLVDRFQGMANLCQKLGYARNETAGLTRILNENVRHDRGGKPYNMGDATARSIEQKLNLDLGWMDTPPTYAELHDEHDPLAMAWTAFESLPPDLRPTALRLIDALTQPKAINGNGDTH